MAEMTGWKNQWRQLDNLPAADVTDARRQLHWAIRIVSQVGKNLIPTPPDHSNESFQWLPEHEVLAQGVVDGKTPFRAALHPAGLRIVLLTPAGETLDALSLDGETRASAHAWLSAHTTTYAEKALPPLPTDEEEIESHPVAEGDAFKVDPTALKHWANLFHNAHAMLAALVHSRPGAEPIRLWPHHFDIASLIILDPDKDPEEAPSVGVGLMPADSTYPNSYLYVSLWPHPDKEKLPALPPSGHWHTEGWVGAVLRGEALVAPPNGPAQAAQVDAFVAGAVEICLGLVS